MHLFILPFQPEPVDPPEGFEVGEWNDIVSEAYSRTEAHAEAVHEHTYSASAASRERLLARDRERERLAEGLAELGQAQDPEGYSRRQASEREASASFRDHQNQPQ
jgi:hypothetical protein